MKELKQLIADKAIKQKQLKAERKTGTFPKFERYYFGYADWNSVSASDRLRMKNAWNAAWRVQNNKLRITAMLNLMHELRGSDYRHNVSNENWGLYSIAMKKLRADLKIE